MKFVLECTNPAHLSDSYWSGNGWAYSLEQAFVYGDAELGFELQKKGWPTDCEMAVIPVEVAPPSPPVPTIRRLI